MNTGTHDPLSGINKSAILSRRVESVFGLPDDMDPRVVAETEAQRAQPRQATVPTLAELKATTDMVTGPDGALLPGKLAQRGDAGWDGEQDRDSGQAAKLAELVKRMDDLARDFMLGNVKTSEAAFGLAGTWQAIRKITQGNQS